jgi:hypothetical protein
VENSQADKPNKRAISKLWRSKYYLSLAVFLARSWPLQIQLKRKKAYDYCNMNAHSLVDFNHVE